MVTENVNVRFRESGARVIKRRIDEIGQAANNATRGIFLLQRALFVIGGAGIARGLSRYADALTNIENRLRLTSDSTSQLEAVQTKLFEVSRRSRSDLQGTADVYNRIALSARSLGVGQKQVLDVTETLQKAAILSGASAREANAALIQLGQGIASDRLSGDELRSVLEQLPFVADIIVDYLNDVGTFGEVTRGTLRQLGKEGKLTSEIVFRAIQASQENVSKLFAQTQPTIDQAFNVARTNLLEFIDTFDDATNASAKIANIIIKLSENFDILLAAIGSVAAGLIGLFAAKALTSISVYIGKLRIAGGALARLRQIQASSIAAQAASTAATAADTKARVANLTAITARSRAQLVSAQVEFAESQFVMKNGRARSLLTGQFIANATAKDKLTAASIRLANAERINLGLSKSLTGARAAQTAADNAAAVASTRAAAARAAQSGILARLSAAMPRLAGAARVAVGGLSALFAVLAANPIGAVITAISLAGIAIFSFGNRIKVTEDGVVGLRDATIAAFQLIFEAIEPVTSFLSKKFRTAFNAVAKAANIVFPSILEVILDLSARIFNLFTFIPRLIVGVIAGSIAAFNQLGPGAGSAIDAVVDIFVTGFENIANVAIDSINEIIEAINSLADTAIGRRLGFKGIKPIDPADLSRFRTSLGAGGKAAGDAFRDGFNTAFEGGKIENILDNVGDRIIKRARENLRKAKLSEGEITDNEILDLGDPNGARSGSGSKSSDFLSELAKLQQLIELERQYGIQKEISNNILNIEKAIKRDLTSVESEQVAQVTRLIEVSRIQGDVLQSILGPQETLIFTQKALNDLYAQGAVTLSQYIQKLKEAQIASDKVSETVGGGFRSAIASSILSVGELGNALGDVVVGAANSAADAIVEFAKTGKLNIQDFFSDLFSQLLKLASQQLLLNFIGNFIGVPTIPNFSIPAFATGGSILPTGPGSTDSQIVSFAKRPDERVDILTPAQQRAGNSKKSNVEINIINNSSANVSQQKRVGPDNKEYIDVAITDSITRGRQDAALKSRTGSTVPRNRR